jgi:hypothetical protein
LPMLPAPPPGTWRSSQFGILSQSVIYGWRVGAHWLALPRQRRPGKVEASRPADICQAEHLFPPVIFRVPIGGPTPSI